MTGVSDLTKLSGTPGPCSLPSTAPLDSHAFPDLCAPKPMGPVSTPLACPEQHIGPPSGLSNQPSHLIDPSWNHPLTASTLWGTCPALCLLNGLHVLFPHGQWTQGQQIPAEHMIGQAPPGEHVCCPAAPSLGTCSHSPAWCLPRACPCLYPLSTGLSQATQGSTLCGAFARPTCQECQGRGAPWAGGSHLQGIPAARTFYKCLANSSMFLE